LIERESQWKQIIDKPHRQDIHAIKHFTKIDQRKNVACKRFKKSNYILEAAKYLPGEEI